MPDCKNIRQKIFKTKIYVKLGYENNKTYCLNDACISG